MMKPLLYSFLFLTLVMSFQNCGSKVEFTPMLTSGAVDANGNALQAPNGTQGTGTDPIVVLNPTPTPPTDWPAASPIPETTPGEPGDDDTGDNSSSGPKLLCIVKGKGQSNRVGFDTAVQYMTAVHAIPKAVCMSANACLNLVNAYLNLTGGSFSTRPGQPANPLVQYTQQKLNGVCAHNKHVRHMSDEEIQAEIQKLMSKP